MTVVASKRISEIRKVLNVRVSARSRRNLDAACKRFRLGIGDLVDIVLEHRQAIDDAVIASFARVGDDSAGGAAAPGAWRTGLTSQRLASDAEARAEREDKRGSKLPGDTAKRGGRRGHR